MVAKSSDRADVAELLKASEKLLYMQRQIVTGMALMHLSTDAAEQVLRELERDVERLRRQLKDTP